MKIILLCLAVAATLAAPGVQNVQAAASPTATAESRSVWAAHIPASAAGAVVRSHPLATDDAPWSVRMAESVMARAPTLNHRWHYEVGVMLTAFEQLYERTGRERYFDFIRHNMDEFVGEGGAIRTYKMSDYNLDQINAGKLLFPLYARTGRERYRMAADTLREQLRRHPRTSEGGFWHKQVYPYQLWLDGVYMAGPFLTRYGAAFGDAGAFDDIAHEILLVARHTRDPRTGLFYHGWDEKRQQVWADSLTGLSPNFWGRAMGWYAMALVDVLDDLPESHAERGEIIRILQDLARAVAKVQDPVTGLWYQVLDMPNREGNYLEGSASSMFVYALAKGARNGHLSPAYRDVARRGYRGLLEHLVTVDDDGLVSLTQICSVAGLGGKDDRDGSFEYYISEPVVANDPKGVGPFIMASIEIERAQAAPGAGIGPWVENQRYWQFKGEPVLLLGGTDTDAIFQWDAQRLKTHLDLLVSAGGNYIRNVLSARNPVDRGDVHPFSQLDDGRYDLDEWNPEYWVRFERMLEETARRDIIVQIELWDGHDFQSRVANEAGFPQWEIHPLNPKNNVNYTAGETSIPERWTIGYPDETHPVLRTVPELNDDPVARGYQDRFIGAVLERSLDYDHVLYVIQNESWVDQPWADYWAALARKEAAARGKRIYLADMQFHPITAPVLENGFDFAELSQSASGAGRPPGVHVGQGHFDHIAAQWKLLEARPAPVNSVKQYGGDEVDWSISSDEGVERVWRSIFAGQAAVRFHRPPTGIGLSERAQANLRSLRMVTDLIDIFRVQPHQNVGALLGERADNEAYMMADPGRVYVIFFTAGGGSVTLDASAVDGRARVRWLNPNTSEWASEQSLAPGKITLAAPDSGQWVALILPE